MSGLFGFSQFSKIRKQKLSDNTTFLGPSPISFVSTIGGGQTTVSPGNGYLYTTFTASGQLTVNAPQSVDIFVVAGGGAGGSRSQPADPNSASGGGGGGGIVYVPNVTLSAGTYTVLVGGGGANATVSNGTDSEVRTGAGTTIVVAKGGGSGKSPWSSPLIGFPGGSGGGSVVNPTTSFGTGIQPTTPQPGISTWTSYGFPGGSSDGPSTSGGGGGGGASSAGGNASPTTPSPTIRNGGNGLDTSPLISGFAGTTIGVPGLNPLSGWFSGGGGGGGTGNNGGNGGRGGGGGGGGGNPTDTGGTSIGGNAGSGGPQGIGGAGITNSGGGGGGAGGSPPAGVAGVTPASGGSGIVVVRYYTGL